MRAYQSEVQTVDALRRQAFELSRDNQYRLAFFIAEHIGFGLTRCTCGADDVDPLDHHDISCPAALAAAQAPSGSVREALDIIDHQLDEMRSLKGWRLNLIRENMAKVRAGLAVPSAERK